MGATNVFTFTLEEDSLSISASDNVQRLSVICRHGSIEFIGSSAFQGTPSQSITIEENQGVTLTSSSTSNPIDGVTITATGAQNIAEIIISTS